MTRALPLAGIDVVEHGTRIAVSACGTVLASLGANVYVTAANASANRLPRAQRTGKHVLPRDGSDEALHAMVRADVLIASSDLSGACPVLGSDLQIACDITAYGSSGPMAGTPHADALVQAYSGLADTTGEPDAPPTLCRFPQTEGIAALYAAAGILAALYERSKSGRGQAIEIALFDCAFSTLSTFLPFHFVGKPITRSGNRHVLASPWNAYRASDGWLLVCTGSDEQWQRLCQVMTRADLAADARLGSAPDRVRHREVVDGAVRSWVAALRAGDAARALAERGIAAGEIVGLATLTEDPNIAYRGMYSREGMRSAIRHFPESAQLPAAAAAAKLTLRDDPARRDCPLRDLRVLELGQYTTAPLVARNLGALGAEVLKIEPPGGDATRAWPPRHDGQGYFFTLSNSDKRSLCLDLRAPADCERFRAALAESDVLVENLKPGSLDKLGFGAGVRHALNPRLVYCAISGFGAQSAYPGRPAFDTVIQAASGIMDLVRVRDVPQKTGISFADVLGGLFALTGTLAALVARARSGTGAAIDLSMQDAAAWITQWTLADPEYGSNASVAACADGYVAAEVPAGHSALASTRDMRRAQAVEHLARNAIRSAPVLSVGEVAQCEQARARATLACVRDSAGREWPVFTCPIRLARTPAVARCAIGPLDELNTDPRLG